MMKKIFFLPIVLLTSCTGHSLTQIDVELEKYRMTAVAECYKSKSSSSPLVYEDARDHALVIMAQALAERNGKSECATIAGMNAHEAKVKIAEAQNSTLNKAAQSMGKAATSIAGILTGGSVAKEALKAAGDKISAVGEGNVMGDDRSTQTTTTETNTNTGAKE